MITNSLTQFIPYQKAASIKFPYLNLKLVWGMIILLIISLLILLIFQINAEVSERYLIQKYERKLSDVLKSNQTLEVSLVELNSLDNIIALSQELNFEKVDKIHYIKVSNNQVVAK